jgi:restriction endonuclease S subunit
MECFTIYADKIEGRIDPHYYRPEFYELEKKLDSLKWKIVKLADIFEINRGGSPRPIHKFFTTDENGVNWIKIGDTKGVYKYIYKTNQKIRPEGVKFSREVKEGDFILSNSMSFGRPYIMKTKGCIHDGWLLLREKDKNLNKEFLYYLLSTNIIFKFFKRATLGGVVENLNIDLVKEIKVPLPPIETQNKIVQIMDNAYKIKKQKEKEAEKLLDSIDEFVLNELGIELPELKDKMCYAVGSKYIENKRIDAYYHHPKFEEVEEAIEKGKYRTRKLKEFITKIHYGASVKNIYVDEGIPLLRILNLKENRVDLKNVVKLPESMRKELGKAFVNEGDLLISRSGTVGIVSVIQKDADGYAFGSFMIKFCLSDEINKEYISIWLNLKISKLLTEREKIGAIQGNITIPTIENFIIPPPPLSIQNKIAEEVKRRMQKAERLQKETKQLLEEAKEKVEKMILSE